MNRPLWRPAYIGIGSNLQSPARQIERGLEALNRIEDAKLVCRSGNYRSAPFGPVSQGDFLNGVAGIITRLEPRQLLSHLQTIEDAQGRDRAAERWGPRTLDLDLLACGSLRVDEDDLTLPHPGIAERNFVLLPWAEIAPAFQVPGLGSVARLARMSPAKPRIERLSQ
ncbi:MAG: 2-amino-4-hydroxy-6-hydroxymethyldihydropteridine diphosphokinase [Gammaproteobacteria bacterium]|nr:2-amino-4-hydroxy-6-hydroxymethyldihydropteridine diphosphokinase [Gammaproteobacteria bacterium]